jgi:hypothetical protein
MFAIIATVGAVCQNQFEQGFPGLPHSPSKPAWEPIS